MSAAKALAELPYLSKEELREVIKDAGYFLSLNRKVVPKAPQSEVVVATSEFVEVLLLYANRYMLVPKWLPGSYVKRLNTIAKELEDISARCKLDRRERIRLCDILLSVTVCNMKERKRDISFKTLLYNMIDPKSTLMEAYPGYFGSVFFREKVLNEEA